MTALRSLSLCHLAALPAWVSALTHLTGLFVYDNICEAEDRLTGVERLTALRQLSLGDCGLARLPPQLTALTALEEWTLWANGLQLMTVAQLQGMLACMPRLTQLNMDRSAASSAGLGAVLALKRTNPNLKLDIK